MNQKKLLSLILMLVATTAMPARAQQTTVRLIPESYTVPDVGITFDVNITVENVENLYGWEFKLYYPNDILNGTSVTQGQFLKAGAVATFFQVFNFTDNYNATHGLANALCMRTGNVSGVSGNGTLATITFRSISTDGPRTLQLDDVKLSDPNPGQIPFTESDGEITVIPELSVALVLPVLIALSLVMVALKEKTRTYL